MKNGYLFNLHGSHIKEILRSHYDYENEIEKRECNCCKKEYGYGGELLHRGFYCPSLILDIVTGNARRGKVLKQCKGKPSYIYYFINNELLTMVKQEYYTELIYHEKKEEVGISLFNHDLSVSSVSICQYNDGRLRSYVVGLMGPTRERIIEIREEKYDYYDGYFVVNLRSSLNMSDDSFLDSGTEYVFTLKNGLFSSYTSREYNYPNPRIGAVLERRVYDVTIKRKIKGLP